MATTTFTLHHARAGDYRGTDNMNAHEVITRAANLLVGCQSGAYSATTFEVGAVAASQTVTLVGASGDISVFIGSDTTGSTVTAAGSDEDTALALAVAINANDAVNDSVVATASGNVVTVSAMMACTLANHINFAVIGTGATGGGEYLAGGASTLYSF